MDQDATPDKSTPVADQVVNWLLLLRSGRASQSDYADFLAWRAENPMHESAWQQLTSALGSSFGRLSDFYPIGFSTSNARPTLTPAMAAYRSTPRQASRHAPANPARRRFVAGGVAAATAAAMGAVILNEVYPLHNLTADAATATGERRLYMLSDGSQMLLDARSRVRLDFAGPQRNIRLLEGAITVSVAHDPNRPFIVTTEQGTVRALGTRFMVRQQARRSLVVVHEHEVEVQTLEKARGVIGAGMGARFDDARVDSPRAELLADAAWETGWIAVRNRPLADVVAALRPYRSGMVRISMAAGGLPVTGQFPLDDTDATLDTLERSMPVTVRRYTPWLVSIDVTQA
ncbi:FecR family protein [Bordetella bronchialis]|uniref:Iron dicitrate transport regulator FecR n=1 Tax=Bordetella bronchialis TaxID=463025 RepID=A0A193FZZ5_9BORD|nr:FecR domain-containing protein [Bordetella bronchialis]ANN67674.1 iron dicitrate transport regulator FecR [Bordetella bronchialis]ANN72766.1 iron dicitrate transport regulator FecR [Bordetella bronchialis]